MSQDGAPSPGRRALLLGATGLVGRHCLDRLLADPRYARVRVLLRRPLSRASPRLEQDVVDFERLAERAEAFQVDDVFCCLGTTLRQAGSRDAFRRVDHHYVVEAARLAEAAGVQRFLLVSAVGANPASRVFYNRVKGETEAAVRRLRFRAVWVLRPSLLLGQRDEPRPGERLAEWIGRPLAPLLLGPLRRYRPVHAADVAAAMVRLALDGGTGGTVESERIPELARRLEPSPSR